MYSRFYVVFAVAALLSSLLCPFSAAAQTCGQDCTTPPTCSQLGYKKDIYCPDGFITCPFDTSYKWCKEYTCEDGRYYSSPLAGDYTCSKADYHGLTCYDCVAAVEEDICSAYDEQTLVEALQCDDCPVITVLNDISITDKLPDLKEGQTLKAADGQTYTISINPTGDIQTSDPEFEISQDGQTMKMKLSQLFGTELGIILTTAAGSRIDNIHFDVAATHNVDAVIVPLGDTTFNNLSIVIDGKDEESERVLTAGVLPINPGGKIAFEGDTYIEMKNIKGRQMAGGVFNIISVFFPVITVSVTADNIGILQENIDGGNLVGLMLNLLNVTDDVTITQNGNSGKWLYGAQIQSIIGKENSSLNVNQTNGDVSTEAIGLTHPIKVSAHYQNIAINITQQNLSSSANSTDFLRGMGDSSAKFFISGNLPINIVQKNNYATGIYGLYAQVTAEHPDMPVTIIQTDNSYHVQNYQTFSAITGDNNFTNVTIVQENNTSW